MSSGTHFLTRMHPGQKMARMLYASGYACSRWVVGWKVQLMKCIASEDEVGSYLALGLCRCLVLPMGKVCRHSRCFMLLKITSDVIDTRSVILG